MNAKRTDPTVSLLDGARYVHSMDTPFDGILARWRWERSGENPANYPEYQEGGSLITLLQSSIEQAKQRKAQA